METMMTKIPPRSEDYQPERRNAQVDQPSSKHRPEEFDVQNPAKQVDDLKRRPGEVREETE